MITVESFEKILGILSMLVNGMNILNIDNLSC